MKKVIVDQKEYILTEQEQDVEDCAHPVTQESTCSICYGEINEGDKLVTGEFTNPENEQRTIYGIAHIECAKDDAAERELTVTDQYYDWGHTLADQFISRTSSENLTEEEFNEEANEFLENVKNLDTEYFDAVERAEEIINDRLKYIQETSGFYEEEEDEE